MQNRKNRYYSIDIVKFLASIFISILHFNYKFIPQGYLMVELFFMISGVFIYLNKDKYSGLSLKNILLNRFISFYPYYCLLLILYLFFINFKISQSDIIYALLLVGDIGIGNRIMPGYLWFIGTYFYLYIFYIVLLKNIDIFKFKLITFIIAFWGISALYFYSKGIINITYSNYIFFIPQGVFRGLVSMAWGIILGSFISIIEVKKSNLLINIIIIYILNILFQNVTAEYDFISYFIFSLILYLLFVYENNLLNYLGKKFNKLFNLYPIIYIIHGFIVIVLLKYNFRNDKISQVGIYL